VLAEWDNFAVITGSAAGALTGLLFVAVSLNRDRIVGHAGLRAEAGQTLVLFILALLLTVLLVIPGMSATTLGIVLVAVAVVSGVTLSLIDRNQQRPKRSESRGRPRSRDGERRKFSDLSAEDQLYRVVDVVSPNLFSMLSVLIAGCLLLAGANGLYWLAAAILLALGGGVVNAWLFLTRPTPPDTDAGAAKEAGVAEGPGTTTDVP
jgi:modulator of FtsH protease